MSSDEKSMKIYRGCVDFLGKEIGAIMAFVLPWYFWHSSALYVWLHAATFGSQPECNAATRVIVFGRECLATGSGRIVSLGE